MDSMGGGYLGLFDVLYVVLIFLQNMIEDLSRRNQIEDVFQFVEEDEGCCVNECGVFFFFNIFYFCDLCYDIDEVSVVVFEIGVVLRWRMKD